VEETMDKRIDQNRTQGQEEELVEFDAEMPQLEGDDVEFIADDKLEEEIEEEI
jgi:hypothetical protein